MKQSFLSNFSKIFSINNRQNKSALANGMLLLFTIISVFISPIFPSKYIGFLYTLSVTGIIIFAVLSLTRQQIIIRIFALFSSTFIWISFFIDISFFRLGFRFINFFFFLFLVFSLIKQISSVKTVTFNVIVDSITGYLLLGFAFSLIVTVTSLNVPKAYNTSINRDLQNEFFEPNQDNIYYTFMTFTTTGYGDITPTHPLSKSLAVLISISGQLYLTIIIAMLVGKYIFFEKPNDSFKKNKKE